MLSRVRNCFRLSMYFRVIKQVCYHSAVNQGYTNCDDELQYNHIKESR